MRRPDSKEALSNCQILNEIEQPIDEFLACARGCKDETVTQIIGANFATHIGGPIGLWACTDLGKAPPTLMERIQSKVVKVTELATAHSVMVKAG